MMRQHTDLMRALVSAQVALLDHARSESDSDDTGELGKLKACLDDCMLHFAALDRRMRRLG